MGNDSSPLHHRRPRSRRAKVGNDGTVTPQRCTQQPNPDHLRLKQGEQDSSHKGNRNAG